MSRAISTSSLVGMFNTVTFAPSEEMIASERVSLRSGSISQPNQVNPLMIRARTDLEFSPIPAVKTIASTRSSQQHIVQCIFERGQRRFPLQL